MSTETHICEVVHGSAQYLATVDLRYVVLRQPLGLGFTAEELETEKDSRHLACYVGEKLAACLVLQPHGNGQVQMRQLAVSPEFQRRGIGSVLVRHSETFAGKLGYRRMILHARETAVAFYEKLEYSRLGERFVEVTLPHWEMAKFLKQP